MVILFKIFSIIYNPPRLNKNQIVDRLVLNLLTIYNPPRLNKNQALTEQDEFSLTDLQSSKVK